ncbi:MAG: type III-A CRISPR-associated RAMP protein Csm5, partial [Proteobacteria bacterium]|nr:type III-A CRISPR-associated RAMP protein Csm5 [Pseudomonadota bacterium]
MTANRTASRSTRPSPLLHVLDLRLEVVTPLHIGNGEELIRNYDFVTEGDELVVLDIEAVYGKLFDTLPQDQWQRLANLPLNRVLATSGARDLARYRMPIARGASDEGYETVRAFIKDGFGRPYLPGSSLKGAIRTAFAMAYANEFGGEWIDGHVSETIQRRTRREFAAQSLDQDVFGSRPNSDALRAIRPSDLYAQTDDGHAPLELVETRVTKRNGTSTATIMVEAMPSRTVLHGTMTVDADPVAHLEAAQRDAWQALAEAPALNA